MTYDAKKFLEQFGIEPDQDDLERVNCPLAGNMLHHYCGVCTIHNKPRFQCGCIAVSMTPEEYHQYNLHKKA